MAAIKQKIVEETRIVTMRLQPNYIECFFAVVVNIVLVVLIFVAVKILISFGK